MSSRIRFGCALPVCIGLTFVACGKSTDDTAGVSTGGTGTVLPDAGGAGGSDAQADVASDVARQCPELYTLLPKLGTCARAKTDAGSGGPINVSLSGPVLAVGFGGTCFGVSESDPDEFWFEAADASGTTWRVSVSFPGLKNPLSTGQTIKADFRLDPGWFNPTIASLTLRDQAGSLIVYVGEGGDVSDLTLPDSITAAASEPLCVEDDDCGVWSAYDLNVSVSGATVTVPYGKSASLGGYRFLHGGFELASSSTNQCPDWYIAHVELGIAPAN